MSTYRRNVKRCSSSSWRRIAARRVNPIMRSHPDELAGQIVGAPGKCGRAAAAAQTSAAKSSSAPSVRKRSEASVPCRRLAYGCIL